MSGAPAIEPGPVNLDGTIACHKGWFVENADEI